MRPGFRGHHTELRFGFAQAGDSGFADRAGSDDQAAATAELEEYGEELWRKRLYGFYFSGVGAAGGKREGKS